MRSRRHLRALAAAFVACIAVFAASCEEGPAYRCERCNVVLVSIDTLRADHVGAYGYRERPTTPNLDALADRGVLFENAISQSSWTRAAHMSIFTGLYPSEHGYVGPADRAPLEATTPTLASRLRDAGYATAGFVGGVNVSADYGFDVGFDVYRSNGRSFRDNFEDARLWLDAAAGRPFFLFLHGYDAHTPYGSDEMDRAAVGLSELRRRRGFRRVCRERDAKRLRSYVGEYDAAIHRADRFVGKTLAELDARGLASHTIVVVLSDHGEEFLEHGRCFHWTTLYREVLHVPLVVVAPGLAPRRVSEVVPASVAVAPTLLEMVGLRRGDASLVPAILGASYASAPVLSETERSAAAGGDGRLASLSTADAKYIEWVDPRRSEFYRPAFDPEERSIVVGDAAEAAMGRRLAEWRRAHAAAPQRRPPPKASAPSQGDPAAPSPPDAAEERRRRELRSLGYVD